MRHYVLDHRDRDGAMTIVISGTRAQAARVSIALRATIIGSVDDTPDPAEIAHDVEKELAWAARNAER